MLIAFSSSYTGLLGQINIEDQINNLYRDIEQAPTRTLEETTRILSEHQHELTATDITKLYHIKSDCYFYLGNLTKSDTALQQSIRSMPDDFPFAMAAQIYNSHGQNLDDLGALHEAEESFLKGLKYAKRSNDSVELSNLYYNLALTKKGMGKYQPSVAYLDSCLQIDIARNDSFGLSHTLRLMGSIHESYFDKKLARQAYREALLYVSANDPSQRCAILTTLGTTYFTEENIDSTYHYTRLAEQCFEQYPDKTITSYLHRLKGNLALLKKDTSEAVMALLTGRKTAKEVGNHSEYVTCSIMAFNADPKSISLSEVENLLQDGEKNGTINYLATGYQALSRYYHQEGNNNKAYEALLKSQRYIEAQVKHESIRMVASQTNQYELYKKENEARLATEKLKTRQAQFTSLGLLVGSLFIGTIGYLVYVSKRAKLQLESEKIQQEKQLLKEITEVESQAFRAQMNPHFIFNALNSIKGLIVNKQDKEAAVYISKFSKLVRTVLDNSRSRTISISDEIDTLKMYMNLEILRFRDGFEYEIHVDSDLDIEDIAIPPVTLQPFVENSIWHGFKNSPRKNKITINISQLEKEILIEIEDNGVGMQESKYRKLHNSHGINITKQRISNFSSDQNVDRLIFKNILDPVGNSIGTLVRILIPIKHLK